MAKKITVTCPECGCEMQHDYTLDDCKCNTQLEFVCEECGRKHIISTQKILEDLEHSAIGDVKHRFDRQ